MRARRVDDNLTSVVSAYRALGCTVWICNSNVDCIVGYGASERSEGISELVEVKDGSKPPSARQLTPAQVAFRRVWTGGIRLIESLDQVAAHVADIRRKHGILSASGAGRAIDMR